MKSIKKILSFTAVIVVLSVLCMGNVFADVVTPAAITASGEFPVFRLNFVNNLGNSLNLPPIHNGDKVDDEANPVVHLCVEVEMPDGSITTLKLATVNLVWTVPSDSVLKLSNGKTNGKINKKITTGTAKINVVPNTGSQDSYKEYFVGGDITFEIYDASIVPEFEVSIVNKPSSYGAGQYVNIEALAANNGDAEKDALLIAALYDGNKMLLHSGSGSKVAAGSSIKLNAGFLLPENSAGYKVKVFIWDKWYDPATGTGGEALSDVVTIDVVE